MGHQDYALHRIYDEVTRNVAMLGSTQAHWASAWASMWGMQPLSSHFKATAGLLKEGAQSFSKPEWGITETKINGAIVPVKIDTTAQWPMMDLLHFNCGEHANRPKMLVVAPMSGHYATLLRGHVTSMLPHYDVYITDWINPRDVPLIHGDFGFDDYEQYLENAINTLGPGLHVTGVCQPSVPLLAAVSLMAQNGSPNQPASMTLIAGPIDTRAAPTEVTRLAENNDMSFFKGLITKVPHACGYKGAGRDVYPGYLQLQAFIAMNQERHIKSRFDLFDHLRRGDGESAEKINAFYREYLAVMDMTAKFYLETIERVFRQQLLAKGQLVVRNQLVAPSAITRTRLLTIEGEKDDICALGQTRAAHGLCTGLPEEMKQHFVVPGAGHYGAFSGRVFTETAMREIILHTTAATVDKGLNSRRNPGDSGHMPPTLATVNGVLTKPAPHA